MNPGEVIYFSLVAMAGIVVLGVIWLLFRKRKKLAVALTSLLVLSYAGYYIYFPTMKINTHAARYEQMVDYLATQYPQKEYKIYPKSYEVGYGVGRFAVNYVETPMIGVTFDVDKTGKVEQVGTWTKGEYKAQQDLWRKMESIYVEPYTLDVEIPKITKEDEWMAGELTAFALTIDQLPAVALFTYSKESHGLIEWRVEEREKFIVMEESGYLFVYADAQYEGDTVTGNLSTGEEFTVDVKQKGQLIVEKLQ